MVKVLVAWANQKSPNLGVRALAGGAAALVRRLDPDAEVLTQNYRTGSAPISIGAPKEMLREFFLDSRGGRSWMRSFDLVIDTRMGDSFADIYGVPRLRTQSVLAEFARRCGVPLVMAPQTIGPFQTRQGRLIARHCLGIADQVMARDHISSQAASSLGRPVDVLTTDLVFALPQPVRGKERDVVLNVSGLLWTSNNHGSSAQYQSSIRLLLSGLAKQDRRVTLLAHVLDSDNPDNDVPTVLALAAEYGLDAVVPADLAEVRSVLSGAQLTIGSRMHACLNSLSVGTPAIPLAYSRKFAPLLADIGWPHVLEIDDLDAADRILALAAQPENLAKDALATRIKADQLLMNAEAGLEPFLARAAG